MLARHGSFKHIIGNHIPAYKEGYFYLFHSPTLAKISGENHAKLIDGSKVKYTEARELHRLHEFTSYHQDSKFVGLGKYNPNPYY